MSPEPFDDHSPGHDMPEAGVESKTSSVETAPTAVLTSPGFLHPSSIVFEVLSHVRQFIIPAIIGVVTAAQGSMWGMGFAAVVFAGSLLATLLRYFTLRYRIQDHDFVVTEGLLFRRVRSVPIRRIQNMDLVQNVLHRIFGVAEVNIETASGTKPEATLRVLTHSQIRELRLAIFGNTAGRPLQSVQEMGAVPLYASPADHALTEPLEAEHVHAQQTIYAIPLSQLVWAGLTSNRGLVLLGILLGFYYQAGLDDRIDLEFLGNLLPQRQDSATIIGLFLLGFLALMLALRVVSVAWYVLRFYDYRLTRHNEDLRISCGLFTKVSATVPRRRIQFVSVHRSLLMRWLGLASIRIETAGGSGTENENAATTVSRRWFLPVVSDQDVDRILGELRPGIAWGVEDVHWHGVSPLAGRRLIRFAVLASILLAGVGLAITRPWGWLAGPIACPLFIVLALKKSKARRYARTDWGVAYQSGLLTRKLSFAFYDRIQTLQLSQSPFDKRWRMASLRIDTAASGPAEHRIDVSLLDEKFAASQFNNLQQAAAQHRPSWA